MKNSDGLAVIGLGNPGSEYEATRHNVGFMVADALANRLRIRMKAGKGDYLIGEKKDTRVKIIIIKPLTYMNNSGTAVRDIVERFSLGLDQILIVVDDLYLPFGTLRLRASGSDGGHNGLYSIIYHLNSMDFSRLRCGIGQENKPEPAMADFVLSPFDDNEIPRLRAMVFRARDALILAAEDGYRSALDYLSKHKV